MLCKHLLDCVLSGAVTGRIQYTFSTDSAIFLEKFQSLDTDPADTQLRLQLRRIPS